MGEKPLDLEWLDVCIELVTYAEAQKFALDKNAQQPIDEKRWRIPSQREIIFLIHNTLFGKLLKQDRYMCRSSTSDGKVGCIDSKGKLMMVDSQTRLHFCLVR